MVSVRVGSRRLASEEDFDGGPWAEDLDGRAERRLVGKMVAQDIRYRNAIIIVSEINHGITFLSDRWHLLLVTMSSILFVSLAPIVPRRNLSCIWTSCAQNHSRGVPVASSHVLHAPLHVTYRTPQYTSTAGNHTLSPKSPTILPQKSPSTKLAKIHPTPLLIQSLMAEATKSHLRSTHPPFCASPMVLQLPPTTIHGVTL